MKKINLAMCLAIVLVVIAGCSNISAPSSCENRAKELIPSKLTMFNYDGGVIKNFKWNDGSLASNHMGSSDIHLHYSTGSNEGENVNLYYPRIQWYFEDSSLGYSKQIVAPDGTVNGFTQFSVTLILKPIPRSEGKYTPSIASYDTLDFEVVDIKFNSCKWVE